MRGVVTEWKKYDRDLHLQHCFVKFVHLNAMSAPCSVGKLLSKENLQQLISDKDSSVTSLKHNENDRSSKVWSFFSTICVNNIKQDFVICESCKSLIVYKYTTGTGGMQKHMISCTDKPSSTDESNGRRITSYFNSTKNKQKHVPQQLKDKITNALTEFVIIDSRPFETISGTGFVNLINVVLSTGRTLLDSSTISASDLLVDPRTVSSKNSIHPFIIRCFHLVESSSGSNL